MNAYHFVAPCENNQYWYGIVIFHRNNDLFWLLDEAGFDPFEVSLTEVLEPTAISKPFLVERDPECDLAFCAVESHSDSPIEIGAALDVVMDLLTVPEHPPKTLLHKLKWWHLTPTGKKDKDCEPPSYTLKSGVSYPFQRD